MTEWLALPASGSPPIGPEIWVSKLGEAGYPATLECDGHQSSSIEVASLRVRGYLVFDGLFLEAIHFELHDPANPAPLGVIESIVASVGWELHQYDADDED